MGSVQLSWRLRQALYEKAAAQLDNKRPLTQVLTDFAKQQRARGRVRAADAVEQVAQRVRDGMTLAAALGDDLTDIERSLLAAGETAGQLPTVMRLAVSSRSRNARIANGFITSMMTPMIYAVTLWASLWVVGAILEPQMAQSVPVERWTGWAYAMHLLGQVAVSVWGVVLSGSLGLYFVGAIVVKRRWVGGAGRTFLDTHVFPFTVFREVEGLAWLSGYLALLKAGVKDKVALQQQIRFASPWLESRLKPALAHMRNGKRLAAALHLAGHGFPSLDLLDELAAYGDYEDFPDRMLKVVTEYGDTFEKLMIAKANTIGVLLQMLTFAVMGVLTMGANELQSLMSVSTIGM